MGAVQGVEVAGTGFYVPAQVVTNEDYEERYGVSADWILQVSGIKARRLAAPSQACTDLAIPAAQRALAHARMAADELDLVILATVGSDYVTPPGACMIQGALKATHAAAFDVDCACTGFVWSLHIAALYLAQGIYQNALVIGSEVPSRALNYKDPNTFILMGDGAGACVLRRREGAPGILAQYFHSDGARWDAATIQGGGTRHPNPLEIDRSEIEKLYFKMDGQKIFKFGVLSLNESIDELLKRSGLGPEDIDLVIPHQANLRILDLALRRSRIPPERFFTNLEEYGNAASASVAIALADADQAGRIKRGDRVILVGFGAGLSWGGLLLEW